MAVCTWTDWLFLVCKIWWSMLDQIHRVSSEHEGMRLSENLTFCTKKLKWSISLICLHLNTDLKNFYSVFKMLHIFLFQKFFVPDFQHDVRLLDPTVHCPHKLKQRLCVWSMLWRTPILLDLSDHLLYWPWSNPKINQITLRIWHTCYLLVPDVTECFWERAEEYVWQAVSLKAASLNHGVNDPAH